MPSMATLALPNRKSASLSHCPADNQKHSLSLCQSYAAWSVAERDSNLSAAAQATLHHGSQAASASRGKIEMYSPKYYAACTVGGLMACGLTHWAVTPLDLVKCRRQLDAKLYKGNLDGWRKILSAEGAAGVFTGGGSTLLGYSVQGALKYGLYEYFKKTYSDLAGPENAAAYKTWIYLAGSASAEVFADIGLCPFEAVKIRTQTAIPPFARDTIQGMSKIISTKGVAG